MSFNCASLCVWLWLGLCLAPRLAQAEVARFAIVIGNNQASDDEAELLEYADDDAITVHDVFVQAGMRSVLLARPDERTRALHPAVTPDGSPRRQLLEERAARLFDEMQHAKDRGEPIELYLFFSGHGGVANAQGQVLLEDAPLARSELADLLRRSPADRNHVFIDACSSYFMAFAQRKGEGAQSREPYRGHFPLQQLPADLPNTGFVLSTASERDSHEWTRYRGGILSHELRSALRGAADANTDGRISYLELARFLQVANAGIDNENFRPEITVVPPQGDPALDVLEWGDPDAANLRVLGGRIRHFFVEDRNGVRLLDAHPEPGQALRLWLPETRPLFVRDSDEPYDFAIADHAPRTIDHLLSVEPELRRKGGGALAFALRGLFTIPFGPSSFGPGGLILQPQRDEPRAWPRIVAASVAIAAASAGVMLSAAAAQAYRDRRDGTQLARDASHREFRLYNAWSIPCYVLGAAAGVSWGWLGLRPSVSVSPSASGAPGGRAWSFGVDATF
jgi:hypothetical protein